MAGSDGDAKPKPITFCTINMNGMTTNHNKNKALLKYLENEKIDIAFLQEINNYGGKTETNPTSVPQDKKFKFDFPDSNFDAYFGLRTRIKKRGGTAILISKDLHATNVQTKEREENKKENRVIIDMEISGIPCTIASYYGKQNAITERTNLEDLEKSFFTDKSRVYVIGGDFNTVMDKKNDYFYSEENGKHSKTEEKTLRKLIKENNMIDAFRNKHPEAKEYTYTHKPTGSKSRLDYIFVSQSVENHFEAKDVKIIKDIKNVIEEQTWKFKGVFDHEMVMLSLQLSPIGTDTVKEEIEYESDEEIKPHGHSVTLNFKPGMDVKEIIKLLENFKLSNYLETPYKIKAHSLCGEDDLNTVMDNQKDCSNINGKHSVKEPVQTLRNVIQENQSREDNMIDGLRNKHPKAKEHTRTDKGTGSKSRLVVSECIENNFEAKDVKIIKDTENGPQTVKEEIKYESDGEIKPEGGYSVTLNFKPGMKIQKIKQLLENSKLSK